MTHIPGPSLCSHLGNKIHSSPITFHLGSWVEGKLAPLPWALGQAFAAFQLGQEAGA